MALYVVVHADTRDLIRTANASPKIADGEAVVVLPEYREPPTETHYWNRRIENYAPRLPEGLR